ncbi:MAG: ATP-binding protein, partial [Bacteroidota bacterium]
MRQVLDNSRETMIQLRDDLEALELYVRLEAMRHKDKFDYDIDVAEDVDQLDYQVPPLLIHPFVENAIRHGIMNKEGQGNLRVAIRKEAGNQILCVTIEDDGVGRAKALELRSANGLHHTSAGMAMTEKRLALVNEACKTNIRMAVTDLQNGAGKAAGTRVELWIPKLNGTFQSP